MKEFKYDLYDWWWNVTMDIKNALIKALVKNTHLYSTTMYDILWKFRTEDITFYNEQIAKARKESNTFFKQDYFDWANGIR